MADTDALGTIPDRWANPPDELISQLPKKSKDGSTTWLDYLGHADLTLALIAEDPGYEYGWVTDAHGRMLLELDDDGNWTLEGWLTVHGVTRPGVGSVPKVKYKTRDGREVPPHDIRKELIGDLLRNAAMRFGFGTALWSKADAHDQATSTADDQDTAGAPPAIAQAVFGAIREVQGAPRELLQAWVTEQGQAWPVQMRHLIVDDTWNTALAEHLGVTP